MTPLGQAMERTAASKPKNIMATDNQISVVITDQNVADILGHLTAIQAILPFLISRAAGDINVQLGDKSAGFDQKCMSYMTSNPEFLPGYVDMAEVLKDRAARAQFQKFMPQFNLVASQVVDTYNVIDNEIYKADLGYYNSTGDAAKVGRAGAGDIHDDLASRYPGHTPKPAPITTAQVAAK
jgi:hypothetical protein